MVVHVGPRFTSNLLLGRPSTIQIIVDGRNSNTALLTLNYVQTIIVHFNEQWTARIGKDGPPARLVTRAWFNPNLESRWFIVPGIVGLLLLVVVTLVTSLSVARNANKARSISSLLRPSGRSRSSSARRSPVFLSPCRGNGHHSHSGQLVQDPPPGQPGNTVFRDHTLPSLCHRCGSYDIISFRYPAAGPSRSVPFPRARYYPLRIHDTDRNMPPSSRTSPC